MMRMSHRPHGDWGPLTSQQPYHREGGGEAIPHKCPSLLIEEEDEEKEGGGAHSKTNYA